MATRMTSEAPTYRLGERIGAGGMAEVLRATIEGTQAFERTVAIKRMLPERAANPRHAEMFAGEARIMAALHHPNIVAVSDFTRDDAGGLLLAMELVEGVDLKKLVRTGPVPPPVAIYIAGELLRGLGYMHDHRDPEGNLLGLVHRDVSTGNVLVSWDGAVKLCDFGLATACAGSGDGDAAVHGTPCYMSPEQLQGCKLDRRTDLYAVGVILYELLTGRAPFAGASRGTTIAAILRHRIELPRTRRPEIPADLEGITMHLLEGERTRRPEHAVAVIDALDRCAAASHLGRKQLEALLRERFLTQSAGRDDVDALRAIPRNPTPDQAPRMMVIPNPLRNAPDAPVQQAAAMPAHRRTVTTKRGRAGWAWAAVLLVASTTGAMLLRSASNPAQPRRGTGVQTVVEECRRQGGEMPPSEPRDAQDAPATLTPVPAATPTRTRPRNDDPWGDSWWQQM